MDLILYNGQIFSMENEHSIYQAISMKNGLITHIGDDNEILKHKSDNTVLIDLNKKLVFPGFNDSHMHLMGYGAALSQVDLSLAVSVEDVIKITKQFIESNNIESGSWVLGRGWNQDNFQNPIIPNQNDLDQISSSHFIFLRRACGHIGCSNSTVLDLLNLSSELTYTDGGEYGMGIFKENAMDLVTSHFPEPSIEEMKNWIVKGSKVLNSYGITSVQSDDLCVLPTNLSKDTFKAFQELSEASELSVRVYEQSLFRTKENLEIFIKNGYKQNEGNAFFKNGPLKILGDGSLGARTAWLKTPYSDDPTTSGISMYSQSDLDDYILFAQKHNIASAVHCIGNQMLDCALNSIEKAQNIYPNSKLRHGIVHCQITSFSQLERMKRLNVIAYVQPIFLDYDIHIVRERVGYELSLSSYNWRTMMDLNIRTSFGSDAPVETPDPIKGIHCAVTRKDLANKPRNGYLKDQSLSVYEAIHNYTVEGAFSSYEENVKGKLLPEYLADCVVLTGNIFDDILESSVEMTILNGKIIYKK